VEWGKVGTPAVVIDDLTRALTAAIDELTRPVDAIKHQAKTVTVGISRSDEAVLDRTLVREVLAAGAGRDRLSYRTLKVLGDLDADQVGEVMGRSANWVRVTQHRALARLADLLTNGQHIAQEMWADPVMQRTTETI